MINIEQELLLLKHEIHSIKSKAIEKETDKKFETSQTRFIVISIITYVLILIYMKYCLIIERPELNAIVPTIGFNLSQWSSSLSCIKYIWIRVNGYNAMVINSTECPKDMKLKDYNEEVVFYKKKLDDLISSSSGDTNADLILITQNQLTNAYIKQGRYFDAFLLYKQSLERIQGFLKRRNSDGFSDDQIGLDLDQDMYENSLKKTIINNSNNNV